MPRTAGGPAVRMGKPVQKWDSYGNEFWRCYEPGCFDEWLAGLADGTEAAVFGFDHKYEAEGTVASTGNGTLEYALESREVLRLQLTIPDDVKLTKAQEDFCAILDQQMLNEVSIGGRILEAHWDRENRDRRLQRVTKGRLRETSFVVAGSMGRDAVIRWLDDG